MLSVIRVHGIPSFISSHAVSRAPCRKGRVSPTYTCIFFPAPTAARITPSAVPYPAVARAPALQWVITEPDLSSFAPCVPIRRLTAMSSSTIATASFSRK